MEALTVHCNALRLFGAKASPPYSYYLFRASDIAAVGTTFNVFSYDAVWAENWTHHLPNAGRMRYLLRHKRGDSFPKCIWTYNSIIQILKKLLYDLKSSSDDNTCAALSMDIIIRV